MYLRFVRLRVREGRIPDFTRFYGETAIPALREIEGCLYASLLMPARLGEECLSMTLWRSRQDADAYEKGGLYRSLLSQAAPFLSESTEWKVRLADADPDRTLELRPGQPDPAVEGHTVRVASSEAPGKAARPGQLFLRIVSIRLREGKADEFRRRYHDEILPALTAVPGCRHAFLAEGLEEKDEALSVSIWDNEEAAVRYEVSGIFEDLTRKLKDTFSELYRWKFSLASGGAAHEVTSGDLDVSGYHIVAGETF